jgi:hypothetical protein
VADLFAWVQRPGLPFEAASYRTPGKGA